MPIPGLREQERFPKIGDIRKGAKKTEDDKPGADLSYFRYAPIPGEETAEQVFHQVYGAEPRELVVFLPFDEVERNFEAYMERYTASALQCRGDIEGGACFQKRSEDGKMHTVKGDDAICPLPVCEGCKETGRLSVIIPALKRYASVTVHTTSKWDIVELYGNLRGILATEGRLQNIPLVLKRRPRMVSTPKSKKVNGEWQLTGERVRREKWLLSLEVAPRYIEEKLEALHNGEAPRQIGGGTAAALPMPEIVSDDPDLDDLDDLEGEYTDPDDTVIEAAEELGGTVVLHTLDEFTAECERLGISGKEVHKALGMGAPEWCKKHNEDLAAALKEVREVCGK